MVNKQSGSWMFIELERPLNQPARAHMRFMPWHHGIASRKRYLHLNLNLKSFSESQSVLKKRVPGNCWRSAPKVVISFNDKSCLLKQPIRAEVSCQARMEVKERQFEAGLESWAAVAG